MNEHYFCRCSLELKNTYNTSNKLNKSIKFQKGKVNTMANFRTGAPPETKSNGSFFTCADNVIHEVVILVEGDQLLSVDQYGLWNLKPPPVWASVEGDEIDPGKELGLKPQFRAFVPCLVKNDGKWEYKLWSMPKKPFKNLYDQHEMGTDLKGFYIKVRRTGTGVNTEYAITPQRKAFNEAEIKEMLQGSKISTPDEIGALLGPDTRAGVVKLIEDRSGMKYADLLASMNKSSVELEDL